MAYKRVQIQGSAAEEERGNGMTIVEQEQQLTVLETADVCVLGGGTTGVMAAIRAARMGAKVVLAEQQGNFGGNATSGMVCAWHTMMDFDFKKQIISGLSEEFLERLKKRNALRVVDPDWLGHPSRMAKISTYIFNTQELKIECDEMLREAGVIPYLHTVFCKPYVTRGRLQGVIVESKNGRQAILAEFFIDATGDGDLAYRLGVPCWENQGKQPSTTAALVTGYTYVTNPKKILLDHLQEYNLPNLGWDTNYVNAPEVRHLLKTNVFESCLTAQGITKGEMEGRRQVRAMMDILNRHGDSDRELVLLSLSSSIGIREGRHMKLGYTLTGDDVCSGRRFEDAVGNGSYPIDIHHADKPGCTFWYLNGMTEYELDGYPHEISWWKPQSEDYPRYYQIPYRSLLPDKWENLLVCGRAMDADTRAYGAIRVMINLNQTGEAAGVAAALCLQENVGNRELDMKLLRSELAKGGSIVL